MLAKGSRREDSKYAKKDLRKSVKIIHDMYNYTMDAMISGVDIEAKDVQKKQEEILLLDDKMRQSHIERVGKKKCNSKLTAPYNNILHNIDRMGNSCVNLVDMALAGTLMGLMIDETAEQNA